MKISIGIDLENLSEEAKSGSNAEVSGDAVAIAHDVESEDLFCKSEIISSSEDPSVNLNSPVTAKLLHQVRIRRCIHNSLWRRSK